MTRPRVRWLLVVAGVLLWFIAVLPAYYVVHKPLGAGLDLLAPSISGGAGEIAAAILSLITDLALLVSTLVIAAAWGNRTVRWLGLAFDSDLERWALGAMLGLGLLGMVVFGLGTCGGLYAWLGYTILLLLGLSAWREVWTLLNGLVDRLRQARPSGIPWLWIYSGLIALFSLGMALLPPTSWDALVYHLQGPRLYLAAHRLIAVPENFYLNWPAQMEMLFTWGMLLKGDTLAKLFHWIFWPLTAALLYHLVQKVVNRRAGRWAVAFWASVPVVAELAGIAYVDLGLAAFVLAAVYSLLRWIDGRSDRWLVLSALFAGLAIGTKYTAATWLALLLLLMVTHAWRVDRRGIRWILPRATGFVAIAGLMTAPWLLKNWIVTGNPIYPFLWGGTGWNATRASWLTWPGQGYSGNLLDYLALPWLVTVLGTGGTASFDATIGPLMLCLAPLALLVRDRPRAVNYALILVVGQLLYFMVAISQYVYLAETRLLLPTFPLLCFIAAFAFVQLETWDRRSLRVSRVVAVLVTLVLVVNAVAGTQAFLSLRPLPPLVGLESRGDYLERRLGSYAEAMEHTHEELPGQPRFLFLWEPRGYYALRTSLADATLDNLAQLRVAYGQADEALAALRALGFSHLLLNQSGLQFLRGPTPRPPTLAILSGQAESGESLYPLTDADQRFLDDLLEVCQPVSDGNSAYAVYLLP